MSDKLRDFEMYDMQETFDTLYANSKNGDNFKKLHSIIKSRNNILLAYRRIRNNSGRDTVGVDGKTINDLNQLTDDDLVEMVQKKLANYQPQSVRRVYIPKSNGKLRPLGIPTIGDRLIQQCIMQVLIPIYEAKFYEHSYGFRENRNASHAMSRMVSLINVGKQYYCVSIDIKGFFDNVNHDKLKRQLWSSGIRDKQVLSIISKMLNTTVEGEGVQHKGVPQGGILSPLLANIYLDELDKWVASQWAEFPSNYKSTANFLNLKARKTNLKSGYIVRYADDFKIMCRSYDHAIRFYHAILDFLKHRLKLDVSEEKCSVVDLREESVEFLGFKIKVIPKGGTRYGYVTKTDISDGAITRIKKDSRKIIKRIRYNSESTEIVSHYNSYVQGVKSYYQYATNVAGNLSSILIYRTIKSRLKDRGVWASYQTLDAEYKKRNVGMKPNTQILMIADIPLETLYAIRTKNPMNFSQGINLYSKSGRKLLNKKTKVIPSEYITYIIKNRSRSNNRVDFRDNRISKYVAQRGKCGVLGIQMHPAEMDCHHRVQRIDGGTDEFKNLIWVSQDIHKLIHATDSTTINAYKLKLNMTKKQIDTLNKLRNLVGNSRIV